MLMMQEEEFLWGPEVRREELEPPVSEVSEVSEVLPGVTRDNHSPELYIKQAGYRESAQVKISQFSLKMFQIHLYFIRVGDREETV